MFVSAGATILHADLDAFYASVEQRDDPRLRGRPVIVGGGVVLAASYEARACGVRSAMGGRRARRLCPEAIVVAPRWSAYVEASRAVFGVFERTSPLVEGLSIDEAFLDARGLERIQGTPEEIASRCAARCASGSACRSRSGWPPPSSWPRWPARSPSRTACWWSPRAASARSSSRCRWRRSGAWGRRRPPGCARDGIATVGDVAGLPVEALAAMLGPAAGRHLHALAHNRDPRPVRAGRRRGSVGSQCALDYSSRPPEAVDRTLLALVDRVTRRMRRSGRAGRTVVLRLRFGDYSRATRSRTLPDATAATRAVLEVARGLLAEARPAIDRRGLTLLGVAVSNLGKGGPVQLVLPLGGDREDALDAAVDRVRDRFGTASVTRASLSGEDRGLAPWLPPD